MKAHDKPVTETINGREMSSTVRRTAVCQVRRKGIEVKVLREFQDSDQCALE